MNRRNTNAWEGVNPSFPSVRRADHDPEQGNEAGEGSGEQDSWGAAEGAGAVKPGGEEAEGRPYCSLQLPERRL